MGNNTSKHGWIYNWSISSKVYKRILHIILEVNHNITQLSEVYLNITFNTSTEIFIYIDKSDIHEDFWNGFIPGVELDNIIDLREMLCIDKVEYPSGRLSLKLTSLNCQEILLYIYIYILR